MEEELLMGIDIGTQGVKILVINGNGSTVAKAHYSYDFQVPHVGWAEQDPLLWWNGVCHSLKDIWSQGISANQVKGIGVSGQMHSLVILDKYKQEIGNAILWNDVRTQSECEEIERIIGKEKSLEITRNAVFPGFTAPKIMWIRHHEPEKYAKIRHIMLPKDYIVYKLSGVFSCDVTDASGTSLFDVEKRTWSKEIIYALDIPYEWLPVVHESQTVIGDVSVVAMNKTGLQAGTRIVAGAGDNAAAALGNGIYKEGTGVISVGTSGTVFAPLTELPPIVIDEQLKTLHLFCHCLPHTWHAMGVTLSAGMSLNWLKNIFSEDTYEELLAGINEIPAGSEGLLYLPYLNGERTPHNNPHAKGVFFGMNYHHTKDHFTRSVVEGVSYSLKDCYELIKKCNVEINKLYVTGGASKSLTWRRILADIFEQNVTAFDEREGPAFGAALLAGLGVGIWNSPDEFHSFFEKGEETGVNDTYADVYEEGYDTFKQLYSSLKPMFHKENH